ncbi:protein takeout-like [Ctenocephalides felis]|uniref:protein takeout-like n=1 Tax=Ctenocephalides felis TaxID=7515 RepID=UPI000E6E16DF|nr:protein takeout-like [Ctenocephalides felis]
MKTILFVCVIAVAICSAAKLPNEIPRCKFQDTNCLESAIQRSVRLLKDGDRKLNLNALEPLHVTAINIDTGAGNFRLKLDLMELDITGFSTIENVKIQSKGDDQLSWVLTGHVPKVEVKGKYKADGQVLVLPVQGDGDANISLLSSFVRSHICTQNRLLNGSQTILILPIIKETDQRPQRKGKAYMQLNQFDVKFNAKRVTMHFDNLFNGDKVLGDNLNNFINENWQEIFKEVQPALEDSLAQIFLEITNRFFNKVPFDEVYL